MRFFDLLPPERVQVGLVAASKHELMTQLSRLLAGPADAPAVRAALEAREKLGSTGLGHGVAIPHGRSKEAAHAGAAFVRLDPALEFGADDGQAVDLVAALVVPSHFTDQHLKLLAELAELFSDKALVTALRTAPDAATLHAELGRWAGR
jgi:PTS system nitrogen regulatory IIA component